jgi:hypothetical protein
MSLLIVFPSHQHLWWNETAEFSLDQFGQLQRQSQRPGFGRKEGNRPRVYITDPKKSCLASFAMIERILR